MGYVAAFAGDKRQSRQSVAGPTAVHRKIQRPHESRVASCQPFRGQKSKLAFLKLIGLVIFDNLLSSWPYFRSRKVYKVKSKMLPFLKQRLTFVSYKHLATLLTTCLSVQSFPA